MNDNFFSQDNISEITGIDEHLNYARKLKQQYEWSETTLRDLNKQLFYIDEKQHDKCLNISVIGEFSSGKSTFINAVIGYNLLAAKVLQGTTVAITIIEYGDSFTLTKMDYNGQRNKSGYSNIELLKQSLIEYTTNPIYADTLSYIIVTIPSENLKAGFRIIDTPGTNSLELWHEDITRRAIKDLSDLSIVTVDAIHPMPQTLLDFLESNMRDQLPYCSFVLTRSDLLDKKERQEQVEYSTLKLNQHFELDNPPLVLPFASLELTRSFDPTVEVPFNPVLLEETHNNLNRLLNHASQMRTVAQARKILTLLDSMYTSLDQGINKIANRLDKEIQILEKSRVTDLEPFVAAQVEKRQRIFDNAILMARNNIENELKAKSAQSKSEIFNTIDQNGTVDSLKQFVNDGALVDMMKNHGETMTKLLQIYAPIIGKHYHNAVDNFHSEFEKEFKRLGIMPPQPSAQNTALTMNEGTPITDIGYASNYVQTQLNNENKIFYGGAAVGAVIGTAVLPVIGTIIGGFIGSVISFFFTPDIKEIQEKTKQKLAPAADNFYNQMSNNILSSFDKYCSDTRRQINKVIKSYHSEYNKHVDEAQQKWKKSFDMLTQKKLSIDMEKRVINNRKESLDAIIEKLKNLLP